MKRIILACLLLCTDAIAGQVELLPVDPDFQPYPPIAAEQVVQHHGYIPGQYIEIGVLVAKRENGETDNMLLDQMIAKAASIGVDALLYVGFYREKAEAFALKRVGKSF